MWLAIDGDCCYLRAQGAETQELTTRIILPRIAFTSPWAPLNHAPFGFSAAYRTSATGEGQQLRDTDCQARPVPPPCAGARAPTRPRAPCSWVRCSFPPRQKHAPKPSRPACLGASPAARAPASGATGQRLPADSEDTLTAAVALAVPFAPSLRRPPGLGCRCQTHFAGSSSAAFASKETTSR